MAFPLMQHSPRVRNQNQLTIYSEADHHDTLRHYLSALQPCCCCQFGTTSGTAKGPRPYSQACICALEVQLLGEF